MVKSARLRVLLILLTFFVLVTALMWILQRRHQPQISAKELQSNAASPALQDTPPPRIDSSTTSSPATSPTEALQTPTPISSPPAPGTSTPPDPSLEFVGQLHLIVPVAGVGPAQLQDTFADSRSEGRVHDAIDIPAPVGTPVIAAADGEIVKLFQSDRGGTTIYQLSPDRKLIFFYAHLQRYADGLVEGKFARQGEVIGFVGDSGNAGAGNYHLHFSVAITSDPKRYWEGTNINPYPLFK